MPERIAFRMNLNPGQAAAYKKRHDELPSAMAEGLKRAGVSDYTIWLDEETSTLFATLVRTDDHTMDELPNTKANKDWWAFMSDIMEYTQEGRPKVTPLIKMFELK